MRKYPLGAVEAMVANGCSLGSIEDFIEERTHLSDQRRTGPRCGCWPGSRPVARIDGSAWLN